MARNAHTTDRKVERLANGTAPRLLELCSGCGGLSLGLKTAGFELAAHVEADAEANATHAMNFAPDAAEQRESWSRPRDMVSQSMESLLKDFDLRGSVSDAFDVLAAGLPCQAFARIGRSKLRSVTGDEQAYRNDPRATLYRRFLQIVEETKPLAIVLENVPDIMNFGGHNVPEEICETLDALGYRSRYTLLNAAYYGVPQLRERLFLIALDSRLDVTPSFPEPSHALELPRGYEGSRSVALKHVQIGASHFTPIPVARGRRMLPPAITVEDALSDLPFISDHLSSTAETGRRKVADLMPYRDDQKPSKYALEMREWSGFHTDGQVDGNVIRLTARDFPIFGRMPRGGDYPVALRIAHELLEEKLQALEKQHGRRPGSKSAKYEELLSKTVPPYDAGKFPNKWWKLNPSAPSRTLTAHLGKDTYSHIHYDGRQKRMISVREAARLQSFPDGFRFAGAMNASFRQIGNAVPPMLALAVGRQIIRAILNAASGRAATGLRAA